jgi:outer membrane protein assembly factor BamB
MLPRIAAANLVAAARPIAALLLAGCLASGCTQAHKSGTGSASATAPASTAASAASPSTFPHDAWSKIGYRLDWQGYPFSAARGKPTVVNLAVWSDAIVAQERSSMVTFLEPNTGAVRWTTELAGPLTRFVGISRDATDTNRIFVASESELFSIASQTGNLVHRESFERVVNTEPVIAGSLAIFGGSTGEMQAHMIGQGVKAWGFMLPGAVDANPIWVGNTVGAVSQSGEIVFLNTDGTVAGRNRIYSGIATNPVSNATTMFIAGLDQSVWAFDPSGLLRWRVRTSSPLRVQPTADGSSVYCFVPGQGLTAFDAETGRTLWTSPKTVGTVVATRAGRLVVWGASGVSLLDATRGDVMETADIEGIKMIRADKFADGALYIVNANGSVSKLIPKR